MCNFNILQMVPIGSVDFTQGCFKACAEQKISVISNPPPGYTVDKVFNIFLPINCGR